VGIRLAAKTRRAGCLLATEQYARALAVFDELADERERAELIDGERFPGQVGSILWSRAVCLEQLGRLGEAHDRAQELLEAIGDGAGLAERHYVAEAYVLTGKYAMARREYGRAHQALDVAIGKCMAEDDADFDTTRRQAEELKASIRKYVRVKDPADKP